MLKKRLGSISVQTSPIKTPAIVHHRLRPASAADPSRCRHLRSPYTPPAAADPARPRSSTGRRRGRRARAAGGSRPGRHGRGLGNLLLRRPRARRTFSSTKYKKKRDKHSPSVPALDRACRGFLRSRWREVERHGSCSSGQEKDMHL